MDKFFSYTKYAAFALIALLVLRLLMFNAHFSGVTAIMYMEAFVGTLLLCGFFIGLIVNSKKGSPIKVPAIIGTAGESLAVISLVLFIIAFLIMNTGDYSNYPTRLFKVAQSMATVDTFLRVIAFVYLSFYFGKTSSPRFAAWAIAVTLILFFILGKTVNYWKWEDIDAAQTYSSIYFFANNILLYGSYVWFLLGFSKRKRK